MGWTQRVGVGELVERELAMHCGRPKQLTQEAFSGPQKPRIWHWLGGGVVLHCVQMTIEDSHAAIWKRDLPSLVHLFLGTATPNRKIAKYGKSLSHLETCSPWMGRLHAVQKPESPPSTACVGLGGGRV